MPYRHCGTSTVHTTLFTTNIEGPRFPSLCVDTDEKIASSFLFLPDGSEEGKFKNSTNGGGEWENRCKTLKTKGVSTYLY